MEKKTLKDRIQSGLASVLAAVKSHPVEIVILLYVCVAGCYTIANPDILDINHGDAPWWLRSIVVAPFTVVASYSLQPLRKCGIGWLLLYLLPIVVSVVACFMPFLIDWPDSNSYWIAVFVALPLWMLVRHLLTENGPFVQRNARMVWSLARALVIAGIFYLLYGAIAYTIQSLFGIPYDSWDGWYGQVALVLFCGLAPVLFFAMEDEAGTPNISRFGFVLLNWVLTPALLIYMVILYIYAAKILFTWNLPKGGVAIMVSVFIAVVFIAKMLQLLTDRQPFRWFYDHFSLFALPLLVLFWTGVVRRLSDYGLTESRYYLILLGGLMTLTVVVFLFQNRHGYFALTALALLVTMLLVCVPALSGKRIAQRAQIQRVRTIARQLDRLNDDGTLRLPKPDASDTLHAAEHRKLYQSLEYLDSRYDTVTLKREFGINHDSDYLESLSKRTSDYASAYSEESAQRLMEENEEEKCVYLYYKGKNPIDLKGYSRLYADEVFWDSSWSRGDKDAVESWLELGDNIRISINDLWAEQLQKCGSADNMPSEAWLQDHVDELLVYRTEDYLIIFDRVYLRRNSGNVWYVSSAAVDFVLER